MYNALSALGVSVCFALLMKKIERDSLLIRACVFALKFKCSSKRIPSSLKGQCHEIFCFLFFS